jgi:hypothetical protein
MAEQFTGVEVHNSDQRSSRPEQSESRMRAVVL